MRKNFFTLIVLLISSTVFAQNYEYKLTSIYSSDFADSVAFFYNDHNLLEYYHLIAPDSPTNIQIKDSVKYDDNFRIIQMNSFQLIDGVWKHTNIIDYTYDEHGNKTSRTNYADWGWGMEIQGVYTYTYSDENVLTYHEMTLGGSLFERGNYTYNADNLLESLVIEMYDSWDDEWSNSSKTIYEYDASGNAIKINYTLWDYDNEEWGFDTRDEFTYDSNTNCTVKEYITGDSVADRKTFTYDMEANPEDFLMPEHPEPFFTQFEQYYNRPLSYKWESTNDDGVLVYMCDFIYHYDQEGGTSVGQESFTDLVQVYPNPSAEVVTVNLPGLKRVEIISLNGSMVKSYNTQSDITTINIQDLPVGTYLLRANNSKGWQVSKVVVK